MSFQGKDVAGECEPDRGLRCGNRDRLALQSGRWIGTLTEVQQSSPVTNNMASPAGVQRPGSFDGVSSNTAVRHNQPDLSSVGNSSRTRDRRFTVSSPPLVPGRHCAAQRHRERQQLSVHRIRVVSTARALSPTRVRRSTRQPNGIGWTTVPTNVSTVELAVPNAILRPAGATIP